MDEFEAFRRAVIAVETPRAWWDPPRSLPDAELRAWWEAMREVDGWAPVAGEDPVPSLGEALRKWARLRCGISVPIAWWIEAGEPPPPVALT